MKSIFTLIAISGSLFAADASTEFTPRLSIGVAEGLGVSKSETRELAEVSGTYTTDYGANIEIPVVISFKDGSPLYFIAAPAFLYAENLNDLNINDGTFTANGQDIYTQLGGKLYAGLGFGGSNGFHAEVLPYVGFAAVKREFNGSEFDSVTRTGDSFSVTSNGTVTLYGVTVGAYYCPGIAAGIEFGARAGYVAASGKVEDLRIEQSGAMFALEFGWKM